MDKENDVRYLGYEKEIIRVADDLFYGATEHPEREIYRQLVLRMRKLVRDSWIAMGNPAPTYGFSDAS